MPTYTLKDMKTQEQWDVVCSYDELQNTLDNSPDLIRVLSSPNFSYGGTKDNVSRAGGEWRDLLGQVKKGSGKNNTIKI